LYIYKKVAERVKPKLLLQVRFPNTKAAWGAKAAGVDMI
jgi:hypothetical protein